MAELFNLTAIDEAKSVILGHWKGERTAERVALTAALGRILAEDLVSPEDVPGFSRSTVDGYAVRAGDTYGASEAIPAYLRLAGNVRMGHPPDLQVSSGLAVAIPTGGMLPEGADAVVMIEYTEVLGQEEIMLTRPVSPGENVIRRGEDVAARTRLLEQGRRLRPQELGLLASLGIVELPVFHPYKVGIISTGDEIVAPEEVPGPGQVRDINSYTLWGLVKQSGAEPVLYGVARDQKHDLTTLVHKAVAECQLVLISGGSSVGARDYTMEVLKNLGEPGLLLHGMPLKPGKPTVVAAAQGKLLFGLPGHPVSAMVVYELLVHPLLAFNTYNSVQPVVRAKLARNLASASGRQDHLRVKLVERAGTLWAEPVLGKSGLISTMVLADGEVVIPPALEGLAAGEIVEIRLL